MTDSATIGCKLESCFESLKTLNLQVATKPFHIQEVSKPLKLQCTCAFHFTFLYLNVFKWFVYSLLSLCVFVDTLHCDCVCNVHYVQTTLCTLWMIVAASIQCKWFQFYLSCLAQVISSFVSSWPTTPWIWILFHCN